MSCRRWIVSLMLAAAIGGGVSCGLAAQDERTTAALHQTLEGSAPAGVNAKVWKDVRAFYASIGTAPWIRGDRPSRLASDALDVLRSATEHGLDPRHYGEPAIAADLDALSRADDSDPGHHAKLAAFDVRVTSSLLALGRDVALGRVQPTAVAGSWKARRTAPNFPVTLTNAVERSLDRWLRDLAPAHPEYTALQRALKQLYEEQESGAATEPAPARGRGQTARANANSRTTAPTELTVEARIAKVKLNLDRWRWMPDDFGARHFFINIPSYHLVARENGAVAFDTKVVVGKPSTPTPVFSATMATVVFSPYWNIPDTIVVGETAPAVLRDPAYLQRNQIEILRDGQRVDPASVNWSDPDELKSLAFRQRPGAQNALGHVKFLFPNPFNVYLHDTPSDELFERPGRAFSHGCVRVEEPQKLAEYVLRSDTDWSSERIAQAMRVGVERHVKLRESIPVHFVYFTAWVDDSGALQFGPDLYAYDTRQSKR